MRWVILRMAHTLGIRSKAGPDAPGGSIAAAAARVKGLETLIVCWRGDQASSSARAPLVVVTVWLDAEAMLTVGSE